MNPTARVAIVVLVLAAAGGGFYWWRQHRAPTVVPPPVTRPAAPLAPAKPVVPVPGPAAAAIRHPVERASTAPPPGTASQEEADAYFKDALIDLLGRKAVLSLLITDSFAQRVVATVNNLASHETAADLWPVRRPAGQFQVESTPGGGISRTNSNRYTPFVRLLEGIDIPRAVTLYARAYPLLQQAYEDLGFSGRYFNDRVVEVIDHLVATPDPEGPLQVKRVEVAGAGSTSAGPGLYLFVDPALEASSTGQKILLRMGRDNAARVKAKLRSARQAIARGNAEGIPASK